jgi:hypothetical protein
VDEPRAGGLPEHSSESMQSHLQGHKSGSTRGDVIEEDEVHLRLMGEGDDRYCCLSVYEDYGDEGTGWRELHTGTMQGWGGARAKGKSAAPSRLEATWLSMHKLVKEGLVELRASSGSQHGIASFQDVSVSVRLKAAAIERRVLDVVELEDMHAGHKYSHDLHVIMGCFQPALVDRGEQAAMSAHEFEEVGFQSQKLWLHEAMKHPVTEPRAAPHPALKPKLRPYQERAAQWSVPHVPGPPCNVSRPLSAPMCSKVKTAADQALTARTVAGCWTARNWPQVARGDCIPCLWWSSALAGRGSTTLNGQGTCAQSQRLTPTPCAAACCATRWGWAKLWSSST